MSATIVVYELMSLLHDDAKRRGARAFFKKLPVL